MPALNNPKHERFAQELAKGRTADEAYAEAGYKPDRGNASRLTANDNVKARVAEIQGRAAVRAEVTIASLTENLARIAAKGEQLAEASGLSVARAATMDIAKLHGLVIEKAKVESVNRTALISDRPLTEDEWAAQVQTFN